VGIDVRVQVEVQREPAAVAGFLFEPANDRTWIGGVREVRQLDEGPLRVGSRVERVASFLGRRIRYVNEVTELEPGHRLDMRSVEAPFAMRITYTVREREGGSLVENRVRGGSGRLFGLAWPLVGWLVRRSVRRDLDRLRAQLER
jgi:hypothetical protein